MSWPADFHPEVGYLLPSLRIRRLIKFGLLALGFGLTLGIGGTLALLRPTKVQSYHVELVSKVTTFEKSLSEGGEAVAPVATNTVNTEVADNNDGPPALKGFWSTRASHARCRSASQLPKQECSFHKHSTAVASAMEADALQATNSILGNILESGRPPQAIRPQKTSVQSQGRKTMIAPSNYPRQYRGPGVQYGSAFPNRGGFW